MSTFFYKATDRVGKVVEGIIEADGERDAASRIQEMGYIPIRISAQKQGLKQYVKRFSLLRELRLKRVPLKDLLVFTQDFSFLLKSGLPIDKAMTIELQVLENNELRKIVDDVLRRVKSGSYLSDALKHHNKVFTELYINMVKTGESSGRLSESLERLAGLLQDVHELRSHILSSLLYPAFILGVSGLSIIILLTFVIPKFSIIFSEMGEATPLPTRLLLSFSNVFRETWIFLLAGSIAVFVAAKHYVQTEEGSVKADKYKLKLPLIGKLVTEIEVSRFTRSLAVLLGSGVPMLRSIELAEKVIRNKVIKDSMGQVFEKVEEGESLSSALKPVTFFPPLAFQMIVIGEETGRLSQMLLRIAEHYEKRIKDMIKRVISLLEPGIILFMGLIVGFIVISMLLGIFSINDLPF